MIIMRGMGSQVSCFFDAAATRRWCWMVLTYAGSSLGSMDKLKLIPVASFDATEK